MKCLKCEKETDDHSKFCSNCGEKVEERSSVVQLEDTVKMCSKVWFILGYNRGVNIEDKEALEKFENILKKEHLDIWEWYQEVIDFWRDWAREQDNEKNKKDDGPKRTSVPKAKRNQVSQK